MVEAPIDVRTDPDGQSSEPELIVKDQPATEEQPQSAAEVDTNDSGFIECGKNFSDNISSFLLLWY